VKACAAVIAAFAKAEVRVLNYDLTSRLAHDVNMCLYEITGELTKHTSGVQQTLN